VNVTGLSPMGAAFSLSDPKSGEGTSRQGDGVTGSPENNGSKRVRRLSRGRFITVMDVFALPVGGSSSCNGPRANTYCHVIVTRRYRLGNESSLESEQHQSIDDDSRLQASTTQYGRPYGSR